MAELQVSYLNGGEEVGNSLVCSVQHAYAALGHLLASQTTSFISHGLGSNWTAGLALDEVHPDVISANKFVPILNGLGKISQHRFQLEDVTHELAAFLCAA